MNGPDYILDLGGGPTPPASARNRSGGSDFVGRPWLAVKWRCCSVYSRIYRNRDATAYEGRCPRCGSPVRATVGPGGTSNRFFEAG